MQEEEIIYSINIEDVQNVAMEELDRKLSESELEAIADKIGDYIPWYEIIAEMLNSPNFTQDV
ncbi:MAG: hypothetical protein H6611_10325 [Ignavibacteriales bacterium]|nr:hypothetical protein [Leptospiraceae bacterium]MCB9207682.1 hypothetical protein [Ignavibacteriales bacterium]